MKKEPLKEICYCGHPKTSHEHIKSSFEMGYRTWTQLAECSHCVCKRFIRRENERNGEAGLEDIIGTVCSCPECVPVPQSEECDHLETITARYKGTPVTFCYGCRREVPGYPEQAEPCCTEESSCSRHGATKPEEGTKAVEHDANGCHDYCEGSFFTELAPLNKPDTRKKVDCLCSCHKAKYTAEHYYDFGELKSESYEQAKKAVESPSKQDKVEEIAQELEEYTLDLHPSIASFLRSIAIRLRSLN